MKHTKLNFSKRVVCFRKWGNKSYSIFLSLKSLVKISVVSATYSLLFSPETTVAQVTDTLTVSKSVEMDEVIISAPTAATTYSELMRAVVVISKEEISSLPVNSLQQLLENVASVDIRQRGGHGVQADLMIRGGSFDQVLILLNGINITDPQTGHHNLNIPIDLESIERVELLQGPGARVYGPGTFSGAINIITNTKNSNQAKVSASAGENGLLKSSASANLVGKRAKIFLAASTSKSDGYVHNTDFNLHNLFAHAKIDDSLSVFDLQVGMQSKAFGAQSFYTPRFPEQFEQTATIFASASHQRKVNRLTFNQWAYVRNHTDRFELFRYQRPDWYSGHNYHTTWVAGGKTQASLLSILGRTRMGAELRSERIYSNVLGEVLKTPRTIRNFSDTSYTHGSSRNMLNAFAEHTIYLERFVISGGGLVSFNSYFGTNWNVGIDLSAKITSKANASASYNSAIRFPTFTDLYYDGPTNRGNTNLKPERASNFEIGLTVSDSWFSFGANLFHRRGKDVIDWVKTQEEEIWTTMNHTEINSTGIENHISLNTKGTIPLLNSVNAGYMYMYSDKSSGELLSFYALDYLRHKVTLGINHNVYKQLSFTWTATWQDRAGTFISYPLEIKKPYEPFLLINARALWRSETYSAFVDMHNIENSPYFDLGNIPQPGRWISFGFTLNIG